MQDTESAIQTLALTDEGLETPSHVVGKTGVVVVEKPHMKIEFTYSGDGVQEYSELTVFPTTGKSGNGDVPEGHIKIQGRLYKIEDERDVDECPHCGSDKVSSTDDAYRCYTCDTDFEVSE
ncbi:hypothetical protein C453_12766 [Haloferax elongans ATCC BAA-1513]|uniref:Uncharacterized protein n=1 Tax=Haloferax elongans ATCC BAA-1513 TaxID=1230453 RepID=M0HKU5_HALEO|nr:hypothetical protein [Haloferax elongans]ELZ84418.1 hypothetical protein C453_12766 [Haloferax elongans ATCC BAA-1513]